MESDSKKKVVRVGSRKSELALIQTNFVIDNLKKIYPDVDFEIVTMTTLGDRILDVSLPKIGEKSLFTKDLEEALMKDSVDFVVHSLKDLPTTLPDGLAIGAVFEREDPRDALVLRGDLKDHTLSTLPEGSVIGTSSLRRTAQLCGSHPHLEVVDIRGNLNTRLRKLDTRGNGQEYAALVLAKSGMSRMNWDHRISRIIPCAEMLYAVGQGALAVECRSNNKAVLQMLNSLNHPETYCCVLAERCLLKTLGGGCSAPVGISTKLKQFDNHYKFTISGAVWSLDGKTKVHHSTDYKFTQIRKTVKHKLSPTEEGDSKKIKVSDNPIEALNKRIDERVGNLSCEDTNVREIPVFCGMTENNNIPIDVIKKFEDIGKEAAEELIKNGALEVMKVTQDLIRNSIQKSS